MCGEISNDSVWGVKDLKKVLTHRASKSSNNKEGKTELLKINMGILALNNCAHLKSMVILHLEQHQIRLG
jgi:hypothetical protein